MEKYKKFWAKILTRKVFFRKKTLKTRYLGPFFTFKPLLEVFLGCCQALIQLQT